MIPVFVSRARAVPGQQDPAPPEVVDIPTNGTWRRKLWADDDSFEDTPDVVDIEDGGLTAGRPALYHTWASAAPHINIPADNWLGRWETYVTLASGSYYLNIPSLDDSIRVYVNDVQVSTYKDGVLTDAWIQQAPTNYTAPFTISGTGPGPSGEQLIRVDYREIVGTANLNVEILDAAPSNPPPIPVLQGAHTGYGLGKLALWESTVAEPQSQPMHYITTNDLTTLSSIFSWLAADPARHYLLSLNVLSGLAGQFGSATERTRCTNVANAINNAGYASRIAIRPMYELNADYGFEWQPRSFLPGNKWGNTGNANAFADAIDLFQDIYTIFKGVNTGFEIVWCVVPWYPANTAEMESVWPGNAYVDVVGLDVYDAWTSGTPTQRWVVTGGRANAGIAFAREKGKPWSFDEFAMVATTGMGGTGGGDTSGQTFITNMMALARNADDCHSICYFNSSNGGVQTTLDAQSGGSYINPLSRAAMEAALNTLNT